MHTSYGPGSCHYGLNQSNIVSVKNEELIYGKIAAKALQKARAAIKGETSKTDPAPVPKKRGRRKKS